MRKLLILSLLIVPLATTAAQAHAFLDHASPAVGSSVSSAPNAVVLTFTQNLEASFSTVTVTGPGGASVAAGKPQISGNTMSIGLTGSAPGTYKVRWHVLSVDTHTTEGSFSFTVGGK